MKERPILFSAPMVLAILEGRKTQTRRVVKGADYFAAGWPCKFGKPCTETRCLYSHVDGRHLTVMHSPYGKSEDRLWVRETFAPQADNEGSYQRWTSEAMGAGCGPKPTIHFSADGGDPFIECWRPSIHMPRWASRINLEITGVRVERLQDISEADAISEGVESDHTEIGSLYWVPGLMQETVSENSPVESYKKLWERINGPGSWDANPWVWVIEFKRV